MNVLLLYFCRIFVYDSVLVCTKTNQEEIVSVVFDR